MKSFYLLVWLSLLNTIVFGQRVYEITTADDVDDGACSAAHCSLREAINAANANGVANVIRFDIRGNGPQIIYLSSALPALRNRETIVDATTSINNFPTNGLIVLDGGNKINTGLSIQASDVHIFGIQVQNFVQAGIAIGDGVNEISEIVIGEASKGNILINNGIAIHVQKAKTTTIQSNYIGTDLNYVSGLGNREGLLVDNEIESEIFVGGNAFDGEGNIFANHQEAAIDLSYRGYASIAGNRIGTAYNQEDLGNKIGILANNPSGTLEIGGSNATKNIIAHNEKGISIEVSDNLSISQNDFNCNIKSLENLFRQYAPPVFEYAIETIVIGTASPNDVVELYLSEESCGEGTCEALTFLGKVTATPSGTWQYPSFYQYGQHIVALSRNSQNTSEFSECLRVCPVRLEAQASEAEKDVFCKGETIELKGDYYLLGRQWVTVFYDSDFDYHWTGPNGYTSDQQHITDITEGGDYVVEAKLFGCGSTLDTVNIKIADFDVTAGNTGPYCEATSFDLLSTVTTNMEDVSYEWTGPNNFQSSDPNPINVGELGTYNLKINAAGCESETATTAVINHDYPSFSLGADQTICEGETVNLNLEGHQIYQWSSSETIACDTCQSIQVTPTGTTKVLLTAGDYENCVNSDSIIIEVTPTLRTEEEQVLCSNSSLIIFDKVIQESGSYFKTFSGRSGCDSIHTIHVRQLEDNSVISQAVICEGDSYSVFGVDQEETNRYSQTFVASNGCDSIHTIDLVVLPNVFSEEERTLCSGEATAIFGLNENITGTYTKTFQTYTGCDSIHTVHLTVHSQKEITESITACEGESVFVFGEAVQLAGRYTRTFSSAAGCDSIHQIDLDFQSFITTTEQRPICEGETTFVFGATIDTSGIFENTFISQYGCDSIHTIEVFQAKEQTVSEAITICEGTTFNAFGDEVERAGVYERNFISQDGCDSTHIYTIDVLTSSYIQETRTICEGETSLIFGISEQETGSFTENYTAFNGCDSTHTIHLQVLERFSTNEEINICEGETYLLFDSTIVNTAGIFRNTFTAVNGCDSLHEVAVSVLEQSYSQEVVQACEGEAVQVFGNSETTAGVFTKTFTNANGCDSIHTIEVDILQPISITETALICAEETFLFEGKPLSITGTYTKIYTRFNGCDSTHIVQLTVQEQIPNLQEERTICEGETSLIFGVPTQETGSFTENYTAFNGCDSTYTIHLQVLEKSSTKEEINICEGETYLLFDGTAVNTAGVFKNTFTAFNGCDSLHEVVVSVLEHSYGQERIEACEGEAVQIFGNSETSSGVFTKTFTNANGCDSIHTIEVDILQPISITETALICPEETFLFEEEPLNATGTYTKIYTRFNGCDSTHIVQLRVQEQIPNIQEERTICEGETSLIFGVPTQEAGSFTENYTAFNGCDSTYTIHLQVLEKFSTKEEISICEGETYLLFDGTIVNTAGVFKNTFTAFNGCDSLHEVAVNVLKQSYSQEKIEACEGEVVQVFGNSETSSGVFTKTFTNANGCDSIHTIEVDILQPISITEPTLICADETFLFEDELLSMTGTYTKIYTRFNGCDSTHTVQLTIQEQIATTETIRLCEGESISLFGKSTNSGGIYSENFFAAGGCDSTHTFIVEMVVPVIQETDHFFCEGDAVSFYGESIATTTSIQKVFTGANGCDSTHVNHITIQEREVIETVQTVCQNECTTLYDATICASGIWKQDLKNQQGCDSTHIVLLTILEPVFTTESITLCAGDSVAVFGDYLQGGGSYTRSYTGSNGCDSTHTIDLTSLSEFQIVATQQATCPLVDNGGVEVAVTGSAAPYDYQWGHSSSSEIALSALSAGNYFLTVTDANNCESIQSFVVEAFELPSYEIDPIHISCNGVADGSIAIYTTDSLIYQWNESIATTNENYENLSAGQYDLQILDQNNCSYSESIRLIEPPLIQLELPEEITISLGQTLELNPTVIYTKPVDYEWSAPIAIDCADCSSVNVRPFSSTTVQLTVYDENNCEAQKEILIKVDQNKEVYIPNAFSPNGDNQNDIFMIQSGSHPVQSIDVFRVYDRWGTLLFDAANIQPNDTSFGWDGTFDGQPMGIGVYIYYTKVRFVDGSSDFFEGDVTLTR